MQMTNKNKKKPEKGQKRGYKEERYCVLPYTDFQMHAYAPSLWKNHTWQSCLLELLTLRKNMI